jgi:hypothetical protein
LALAGATLPFGDERSGRLARKVFSSANKVVDAVKKILAARSPVSSERG